MDKNPPVKLGEILQKTTLLQSTALKSKPIKCPQCKKVKPPTIFGVCGQCWKKTSLSVLPEDEKEFVYSQVVPPLFKDARIKNLNNNLQKTIKSLPEDRGLFLWGKAGVGKSYALCALARHYMTEGYVVERISYELLCLRLRDSFKAKSADTELSITKPYLEADKLIIEDIGTTKSEGSIESDFSVRTLLVLVDYRHENCMPTFVTTNRPIEELEKTFDARITSRLVGGCEVVKITGQDRRK